MVQMRDYMTISEDQAEAELEELLGRDWVDDAGLARGHLCLRVLGCPVTNGGKFLVIEDQDGSDARDLWNHFAGMRDALRERHGNWVEMEEFGE